MSYEGGFPGTRSKEEDNRGNGVEEKLSENQGGK